MNIKHAEELIGSYRRALKTPEGEVILNDIGVMCGMLPDPEQIKGHVLSHMAGSEMTHAECAYRNGMQDLYKYMEAMVADN